MSITRRHALTVVSMAPLALATPTKAEIGNTQSIAEVFTLWLVADRFDYTGLSEAEVDRQYREYRRLQILIVTMIPITAADLAMQILVTTDNGESEWLPQYEATLKRLAYTGVYLPVTDKTS